MILLAPGRMEKLAMLNGDNWNFHESKDGIKTQSMTFGVIPNFVDFEYNFNKEVGNKKYNITQGLNLNKSNVVDVFPTGDYTAAMLYAAVTAAMDHGDEECQNFASCVMQTLGFEWI